MIYTNNWFWKDHSLLIFTSSSWVKMGPPGICSIKTHPAIHRKSHALRQYCSATLKLHWTENRPELGKRFHGTLGHQTSWSRTSRVSHAADLLLLIAFTPLRETGSPGVTGEMLHLVHRESLGLRGWGWSPCCLTYMALRHQLKHGHLLLLG